MLLALGDEGDEGTDQAVEIGMRLVRRRVALQELEEDVAGDAPARGDAVGRRRDEAAQLVDARARAFEVLRRHRVQRLEDLAGHQAEQRLLALEVIEEGRGHDVRGARDLVDGRRFEALLGEELAGDREDPRADLELAPLAAADGQGRGRMDSGGHGTLLSALQSMEDRIKLEATPRVARSP